MALPARVAAAQVIGQVLRRQGSLSSLLPSAQEKVSPADRALLQELCFGTLRWQPRLNKYLERLLAKPLRAKDSDIHAALLLGLYQLVYMRIPDHAALSETVEVARALKKPWATKLINGILREFQREKAALEESFQGDPEFITAHPLWLRDRICRAWPAQAEQIFTANNAHPPFTLRLNLSRHQRQDYLDLLAAQGGGRSTPFSPAGITLAPCDPRTLPAFAEGGVSVQDEAAQLSTLLLDLAPGQRVLDACCAPGGKTGHMLETVKALDLLALDSDERRLLRVRENLTRLGVKAKVLCGDACQPQAWWDGRPFDRILVDAPCSATGIIRRHPDIKVIRSAAELEKLTQVQRRILEGLWPLLKPNGILLYATCSIMPEENTQIVEQFVADHGDAQCDVLSVPWGLPQPCGRQLLPEINGHDGFYYARLRKTASHASS